MTPAWPSTRGTACPAPSSPGSPARPARTASWTWLRESPAAAELSAPRPATPAPPESGFSREPRTVPGHRAGCPPYPGRWPSPARTAPVRARPLPVPAIPPAPVSGPAVAALAAACRARRQPPRAAAVSAEPRSLALKRVQAEAPSGLAVPGGDGHRRRRAGNASPLSLLSLGGNRRAWPAASAAYHHSSAGYQRISRCVTSSAWGTPGGLPVPAAKV
jgi:hypothetical protein